MLIHYFSDLHLEFCSMDMVDVAYGFNQLPGDVLIFAGDVHLRPFLVAEFFQHLDPEKIKIYVLGNHEFYGQDFRTAFKDYQAELTQFSNTYVLERDIVVFDDQKTVFLGTTLWSDFRKGKEAIAAFNTMSEFAVIDCGSRKLFTHDVMMEFNRNVQWLDRVLGMYKGYKKVVISHHAPSFSCVSPLFKGQALNGGYCSNLDSLILRHSPLVWIHGHVHRTIHVPMGSSTILSNPYGYFPTGLNPDYEADTSWDI